jgi:hypothetical protein
MSIGFDVGTYKLTCAKRGTGDEIRYKTQTNQFATLPIGGGHFDTFFRSNSPLIERENVAYLIGDTIVDTEFEIKRPLVEGILNQQEFNSYKILQTICHNLINKPNEKETVYYSVPGKTVNRFIDVNLQKDILLDVFRSYKVEGKTIVPHHINKGLAIVFAELGLSQRTGIGISFGAGLINFCYSVFGAEVNSFSVADAGDWIDQQVSKATNTPLIHVRKAKHNIDLTVPPINEIDKLIHLHYQLMIDNFVSILKKETISINSSQPVDIVVVGGTSSPNGFVELIRNTILKMKLTFPVGNVYRPDDYLYTVARGCLVAADISQ